MDNVSCLIGSLLWNTSFVSLAYMSHVLTSICWMCAGAISLHLTDESKGELSDSACIAAGMNYVTKYLYRQLTVI